MAGESACRPGLVPGGSLTLADTSNWWSDLGLRSQQFSSVCGASRGDVPPMCPPSSAWGIDAAGRVGSARLGDTQITTTVTGDGDAGST